MNDTNKKLSKMLSFFMHLFQYELVNCIHPIYPILLYQKGFS